jgi:hypothetical protein
MSSDASPEARFDHARVELFMTASGVARKTSQLIAMIINTSPLSDLGKGETHLCADSKVKHFDLW